MKTKSAIAAIPHGPLLVVSIGAAAVTLALKFAAYYVTGSIGLLSDAVESSVNIIAACTALFALWYAAQPADSSHPYGHEKIEFFSSGIEGCLIILAAAWIIIEAIRRSGSPKLPQHLALGIGVTLVAALINFLVARVLLRTAARVDSIVLEADGKHLMVDVWTSVVVACGLALVAATGILWLDPFLALLVAANIIRTGWSLLRRSFDGLMDRALAAAEISLIRATIEGSLETGMAYHALRTRRAGSRRFADYHLLVPGHLSVRDAHDCEMKIEAGIVASLPGIEVTSHIEPIEEPLAWNDSRWHEGVPERQRRRYPGEKR